MACALFVSSVWNWFKSCLFVWVFVCLEFIVLLENFSFIRRRHHYRWWVANFDLCSALMAIEQWGFFCVLHLLWQGVSVYNGHLRGPMTLTPFVELLAAEISLPVSSTGIQTPYLPLAGPTLKPTVPSPQSLLIWTPFWLENCFIIVFFTIYTITVQ